MSCACAAEGGEADQLTATQKALEQGDGGDPEIQYLPKCKTKPSQVVLIGDSYIEWVSHRLPEDLARESGETWRNYAVGGTSMGSGGIGLIPPQLSQALAEDPDIVAAVMDGGGNDILVPDTVRWNGGGDCKMVEDAADRQVCRDIVDTALKAASDMLTQAAANGIHDVIYFFYPRVPEPTLVGGLHPNAILDYALPKAKAFCEGAAERSGGQVRCHFLDLVPVFAERPWLFAATDIHPNYLGSAAMAGAIWDLMKKDCVGQPASSGCCAP